ncbi:MAG: N-6 DNA methylase [Victivallales bacterium]|nr:N-6 DNA methylase [Victivallales bacterium]
MNDFLTEDEVRVKAAKILKLDLSAPNVMLGTGQLTTFNQLGFAGVSDKPDGWYLPYNHVNPAVVLECKSSDKSLDKSAFVQELLKNCGIVKSKYDKVVGILYNGYELRVFQSKPKEEKNGAGQFCECAGERELKNVEHYLSLFNRIPIDKGVIFNITKRINELLHFKFQIKNLYHRMIFTACALVAKRFGAVLTHGMDFGLFQMSVANTLKHSYSQEVSQNDKLNELFEVYSSIQMNNPDDQGALDEFLDNIEKISEQLNSDFWNGEDVMAIFFTEFNRYKRKADHGQVFTPDHITSLMYRILGVQPKSVILDAACGSGAFLVKAMCNMIRDVGAHSDQASHIRQEQLFGIELDREIFALACANMLIHKDGKTNLKHLDARSAEAAAWIRKLPVDFVMMNPPFEDKYGCLDIVGNVLDNVRQGTLCGFILPDTKFEKNRKRAQRLFARHRLLKIVKLPLETFVEAVETSIYIIRAHEPQNGQQIFSCAIRDDGLETIKNQGRQDIHGRWNAIEDYWTEVVYKQSGDSSVKWLAPTEPWHYPAQRPPLVLRTSDFQRRIVKYLLYRNGIDELSFKEAVLSHVLFQTNLPAGFGRFVLTDAREDQPIDTHGWKPFSCADLFAVYKGKRLTKKEMQKGDIHYIGATAFHNGVTHVIGNTGCLFEPNCITVCYNGSIGEAFWQTERFWASDDVNVLRPKLPLTMKSALFFTTLFYLEGQNYSYTNKWKKETMEKQTMLLPVTPEGKPDLQWMEAFIEKLLQRYQ